MASTSPPPFDDPSVLNPLSCPPLRWGILGCGRVSHDFTQALKHLPSARVVACAARSDGSAKAFATKHEIPNYYGSYDDLVHNEQVQCVYVGNIHSFRRSDGEKCLLANKHVILEKPFACSVADAEYLIRLAKERNLFLMEGMWTRFFPALEKARQLVFGTASGEPGILGEVVSVLSDFQFNASDSEEYPSSFFYNRKLGGGASFLIAPYPLAAATLFFGGRMPEHVKVCGQVDAATGVDLQGGMVVSFPPTGDLAPAVDPKNEDEDTPKLPGCGMAMLSFGILGESKEETTVIGTKGRLTIETPAHCPLRLKVSLKASGRGKAASEETYEFPLPENDDVTERIERAGGYIYPNSAGLAYEAAAVARCVAAGRTEAPQYTLAEMLINVKLVEEIRTQMGVKPIDQD